MAPVAATALPTRLEFPDYKLSHRPSSVRFGEERARAETARVRCAPYATSDLRSPIVALSSVLLGVHVLYSQLLHALVGCAVLSTGSIDNDT